MKKIKVTEEQMTSIKDTVADTIAVAGMLTIYVSITEGSNKLVNRFITKNGFATNMLSTITGLAGLAVLSRSGWLDRLTLDPSTKLVDTITNKVFEKKEQE